MMQKVANPMRMIVRYRGLEVLLLVLCLVHKLT